MLIASRGPADRLDRLLGSIDSGATEVIVVDNGSPGGEVSRCSESYERARALRLEQNAGFSRAVNLAAAQARGEAIVLLNDDCVCEPGFVEALTRRIDPRAGVGMAAAVLLEPGEAGLIDSAGMELDSTLLVYDYLNGEPLELAANAPAPFGPSAAAAAFDRDLFLDHGGFDERIFAYWEDVDLVLRMRRDGIGCALAADAVGEHHHSATLGSGSAAKNRLMGFGRGYVLRKWGVLSPARASAVLARELALIAGQAVIDRNLAGAPARLRGWRAAAPSEEYPAELLARGGGAGLIRTLARRLARRRRLASR